MKARALETRDSRANQKLIAYMGKSVPVFFPLK
jgi:hypothetical protein